MASIFACTKFTVNSSLKKSSYAVNKLNLIYQPVISVNANSLNHQQIRTNWQAFLGKKFDRTASTRMNDDDNDNEKTSESKQYKYEDWIDLARGFHEPMKGNNALLKRFRAYEHHIKPTVRRRLLNSKKLYHASQKKVNNLTSYIQFVQDHSDDFRTKK